MCAAAPDPDTLPRPLRLPSPAECSAAFPSPVIHLVLYHLICLLPLSSPCLPPLLCPLFSFLSSSYYLSSTLPPDLSPLPLLPSLCLSLLFFRPIRQAPSRPFSSFFLCCRYSTLNQASLSNTFLLLFPLLHDPEPYVNFLIKPLPPLSPSPSSSLSLRLPDIGSQGKVPRGVSDKAKIW